MCKNAAKRAKFFLILCLKIFKKWGHLVYAAETGVKRGARFAQNKGVIWQVHDACH